MRRNHDDFFRNIERQFFGNSILDELDEQFGSDPFFGFPFGAQPQQQTSRQPPQRVASIEILDDEVPPSRSEGRPRRQPVIEEPDDFRGGHRQHHSPHSSTLQHTMQPPSMQPLGFGGGGAFMSSVVSYSSSSSSSTYGGSNGHFYSSTTTSTMGPGGVRETQRSVKDSRSGTEKIAVQRSLGGKSYTVEKSRSLRGGQEETMRTLDNLNPEEIGSFDRQWQAAAERNLPRVDFSTPSGFGGGRAIQSQSRPSQHMAIEQSRSAQQTPQHSPSSRGSRDYHRGYY